MRKIPKKIKGKRYFVLLCDGTVDDWLICGVYSDRKEALKMKESIKDCPGRHILKKCSIEITL